MNPKGSRVKESRVYLPVDESNGSLATLLDDLADGGTVTLGEFGDAGTTTDADSQAATLREIADALRR